MAPRFNLEDNLRLKIVKDIVPPITQHITGDHGLFVFLVDRSGSMSGLKMRETI